MPKISALQEAPSIQETDELPIVDASANSTKRISLAMLKGWLQSLIGWISPGMIDMSTFDDVAQSGISTVTINSTNTTRQVVTSVDITVTKTTKVLATGIVSCSSTTDTEYGVYIYLDGVDMQGAPAGAINASGSARYIQRSVATILELSPGTHTVQLRLAGSAGTLSCPAGRGHLFTSLASMRST